MSGSVRGTFSRKPPRKRKGGGTSGGGTEPPKGNGHDTEVGSEAWRVSAHINAKGNLIPNLHNADLLLREDPLFAGLLGWDEMARQVYVHRPVPQFEARMPEGALTDLHAAGIQTLLQRKGMRTLGIRTVLQAIGTAASGHPFHPIRDYLNGLTWDGQRRLDKWMTDYLGAHDSPYTQKISRCFLIAMVARVMEPGCKSDHMIVLEGPQGARKSTACKVLAGGDQWFSDTMPSLKENTDHVRISMHVRDKWLIEMPELAGVRRADVEELKAFLSVTTEKFIAKYAHTEAQEPRQCVFVATTNKSGYLKDETGGRRFWPVRCGATIDYEGLERARDWLFAEAVAAYQGHNGDDGEAWWPEPEFERTHFLPEQEARFEADPWQKPVGDWLDKQPDWDGDPPKPQVVWITDLASKALEITVGRHTPETNRRVTGILERLGWVRVTNPRNKHGIPWKRGPDAAPYEPPPAPAWGDPGALDI